MDAWNSLFACLEQEPDRPLLRGARWWNRGDVAAAAGGLARRLKEAGVRAGDRVVVGWPASVEALVAVFGVQGAGAVAVPLNPRSGADEVAHAVADCDPAAIVAPAGWGPAGRPRLGVAGAPAPWTRPDRADEDPALIVYTSGTTGPSKGAVLSYRAVAANISALTTAWRWSADDDLVLALPLFHVHGLCIGGYGTLIHGARARVVPFDPAGIAAELRAGGSVFMGVPTMYGRLLRWLDAGGDATGFASARLFTSGSAALPADWHRRWEEHTGHRILERYGMSETLLTLSNPYEGERRAGSVGTAVGGCEVVVVGDDGPVGPGELGEIRVRGISLFSGYWGNPTATSAAYDGDWFLTGDLATVGPDGRVAIAGRRSADLIKTDGWKVGAREIEDLLRQHPGVGEIAVLGVPDPQRGERIVAAVVAHPGEASDGLAWAAELQAFVGDRLAAYKRVRQVRLIDALPRNALGKVQKHRLRELDW